MSTARWETLMARDGHQFAAYLAPAAKPVRGAVVVLQEIFGVNAHIRSVVEQYAAAGFLAIAPALFDRIGRNIELGYTAKDMEQGTGYRLQVDEAKALLDIGAAINVVRHAGRVALVGYCWGGQMTWVGAATLPVQAAVGYYTSRVWEKLDRVPACPILLHYGERDANIPRERIEQVRTACPAAQIYMYPADHGFNCDARAAYDAPRTRRAIEAANTAWPAWAAKTAKERATILRKWFDLMMANQEDLAVIMTSRARQAHGREPRRSRLRRLIHRMVRRGRQARLRRRHSLTPKAAAASVVLKQPIGVVAAITPWNFPNADDHAQGAGLHSPPAARSSSSRPLKRPCRRWPSPFWPSAPAFQRASSTS
jgi:carboxymethylenebutenolidase